ncbi:RNA polymerase sigma factor [Mucilaginibacter sp. BJC16-A38]|uniref:RNA polymerase sigma factor n=1 Tax=Mucilaginibacter phenanthrenivorans TaxID=1234842 RepID=UPI00215746A2|nr:RNA polymerase sigma factor [Mucilaginibacter phenanthrenivorans]MCR8556393.1 RNA polymerase sigma factor [Mucilaginibacter phenanthrenivorans]
MDDVYVEKVCQGDIEAFRYFLKKYKDMAFSLSVSILKDEFIAEEVVQESFIKAFNGIKSFNSKSSFRTWFYRIVLNEAFQRRKKIKREFLEFQPDYNEEIVDESFLLALDKDEQIHTINEALKMLPDRESVVLRLFYLEEESIKDVCEITGWSESNTKVILHRARKSMLNALNKLIKLNH